jgi:RNA polymerase sigma-70 factor (ECF subfamily)
MTEPNEFLKKNDPDTDLVQAIQAGDQTLFTDLVQRYERTLYNFGMRMCGAIGDAEDLVQETFLNVFRYLKDFRRETKFKNWLYRIAASVCIKRKRRSKFAPERELSLDDFLPGDEADINQQVPQWAALPLDQVLNEEMRRKIQAAILELPEIYRTVLVLRDMEGFSTEEAAQILNLTSSNIKVRLHRARLFLREQLKSYYEDL